MIMLLWAIKPKIGWNGLLPTIKSKNLVVIMIVSNSGKVDSILKWAQDVGMRTGIVTDMGVTHATPAALYAHSTYRFDLCPPL